MDRSGEWRALATCTGIAAGLAVALVTSTAGAQDVPAPPPPPPPAAPPPPTTEAAPAAHEGLEADDARFSDANSGHVILGSTAETHPKGTFFFNDYELFLLTLGYALTDEFQIQLSGVPPLIKDQPYFFDIGAKLNVVRTESFRAAINGALDIVTIGGTGVNGGPYYGGRLGGIAQVCFISSCRSSLSFDVGGIITSGINQVLPIYGSAGVTIGLSKVVSLLAEPAMLGALGTGAQDINGGAYFVFGYGVRFSGRNLGVDVTLIEPVAATTGSFDNPFILGYPWVAFTYRTDGDDRPAHHAATGTLRRF